MSSERHSRWTDVVQSLWFMPAAFVVVALIAGSVLSNIDIAEDSALGGVLFKGTPTSARQLLAVVSSTMITVTGLVFVLTVIALQIAASQFSPRLLRFFLKDFGTRLVLSTFVATFAYSLAGLFTVGRETIGGEEFLPQVAVSGALVLALVSVGMLVFYIQHITNSIRIDTIMRRVEKATLKAIERLHPLSVDGTAEDVTAPEPPTDALVVDCARSGYVEGVDLGDLEALASAERLVIRIRPHIGHHLVAGSAVAWVWSVEGAAVDATSVRVAVNDSLTITSERLADRDLGFGLRQLVDVAIKAVSPSVNDPYTSVQAVQHLSVVLTTLAELRHDDRWWSDAQGRVRVYIPTAEFAVHLETVCGHIRRAAANRPRVMVALLRLLETVAASNTTTERRKAVSQQIELVIADAEREIPQTADLGQVRTMARAASRAAETGEVDHLDAG